MIRFATEFPTLTIALAIHFIIIATVLTIGLRSKLPKEDKWILGIATIVNSFIGLLMLIIWRKKLR
jgi:hypothetical protein